MNAISVDDSKLLDEWLLGDEVVLYTDATYSSQEIHDKLKGFGIKNQNPT